MAGNSEIADTRELQRVERLARVEVKLDTLTKKVDDLDEKLVKRVGDHETRLVKVERIIWLISGIFLIVVVPITLAMIAQLLGRLF